MCNACWQFSRFHLYFPFAGQVSYNEQQQRAGNGNGRRLAHKSEEAERLNRLK